MYVVTASNIIKTFGIDKILDHVSFHINTQDRIGLVGKNGSGKTTLLKIIKRLIPYDSGELFIPSTLSIGYLEQNSLFDSTNTLYNEMLSVFSDIITLEEEIRNLEKQIAHLSSLKQNTDKLLERYAQKTEIFNEKNGYSYQSEIKGVLNGLGFPRDYFDQNISKLSGGEKTRLSLAKILLNKPDVLLLDEPTNHLDMDALQWLEQYIRAYPGTVLLISHDRYFLDQTTNRIFEIDEQKLDVYEGNYSTFLKKKEEIQIQQLRSYEKQQKEISKQEDMIRKFKQHGTEKLAKRAKSRENRLSHIKPLEKPQNTSDPIKIKFKQKIKSGNDVLFVENAKKAYGSNILFENISFDIKRQDKVAIIGPNGIGKTTLLKMILSLENADCGSFKKGHNVFMGYFDQEQKLLNDDHTVLEEIHNDYTMYTETEIRNILGAFLFREDDVFKKIAVLSGGERSRLSLLKLMLSNANFLIMDEPTNHLDIESKEIFEKALLTYEGTLLIVSHDRFFLNRVPNRIIELSKDGSHEYLGNYNYYIEKKRQLEEDQEEDKPAQMTKTQKKELQRKEKERLLKIKKQKQEMSRIESEIASLEQQSKEIQQNMCNPAIYADASKNRELHMQSTEINKKLTLLYEQWEDIALLIEENRS